MFLLLHYLLLTAYATTPILYAAAQFHRWHRDRNRAAIRALGSTATAALVLGGALTVFFAVAIDARPRYDQALLAWLFFMTVLIAVKGLMLLGRGGAERVARQRNLGPRTRSMLSLAFQAVLVTVIGMPYIMSAVMTYRPKVAIADDPASRYGWPFEVVTFKAADGVSISAWWIPATAAAMAAHPENARRTVLVCHGLGANKINQLHMARLLHPLGYNVLTFDFRAHGGSGGQFSSFGDLERRDVLAAVRWLKTNHPREAVRIVGMGASLGAAALVAAASQVNAPMSREIDALILYGTYADLGRLSREVPGRFPPPLNWLAAHIAVPLASVHVGTDLTAFRPVDLIGAIAPRPVMIVHGRQDEIIPVRHGQELFDAAREPKRLILLDADHNSIVDDDATAREAVRFLSEHLVD